MPFPRSRLFLFICYASLLVLHLFLVHTTSAYDITVIKSDNVKLYNDALEGFKSSCNCTVEVVDLARHDGSSAVKDILDASPDAVVAVGSKAYRVVRSLKSLPVFTMLTYPFDKSKNGNIWWVSTDTQPARYLAAMSEVLPRAVRIGIVFNPALSGAYASELARTGKEKGLQLILKEVSSPRDVPAALSSMSGEIDLLMMIPDTTVASDDAMASMVTFSYQNTVPIMTFSRRFLTMGALLSFEIDPFDIGAQTGDLAMVVLRNGDAKARGIYYARKAVLTINRKIATKLGIRIPDRVLRKAEVLQ